MKEEIHNRVDQLFDPAQVKPLTDYVKFVGRKKSDYSNCPKESGLYAFWLKRPFEIPLKNYNYEVKGPRGKSIEFSWDWHYSDDLELMYVGKTTNIPRRISMHLMLGRKSWYDFGESSNPKFLNKITTSCQFRAGLEHLIRNTNHHYFDVLQYHIYLSIVKEFCPIIRFYAEDLAIGQGLPWFNLDSER